MGAFHEDLSERGQMDEDVECMIQFTVLFKKTGKTKIFVFRDAAFIAVIGNQRKELFKINTKIFQL